MFREIRTRERITDRTESKEELGYLKIKPETEMTVEEVKGFWDELFKRTQEEARKELYGE